MQDGGHHNYRQSQDGTLHKSPHGHPLCNYCGIPSHKREKCTIKAADRAAGLTRIYHPDRDKAVSNHDKAKAAAAAAARETAAADTSAANTPVTPAVPPTAQWPPWTFPWATPPPGVQTPFQGPMNPWQHPQTGQDVQAVLSATRLEHDRRSAAIVIFIFFLFVFYHWICQMIKYYSIIYLETLEFLEL